MHSTLLLVSSVILAASAGKIPVSDVGGPCGGATHPTPVCKSGLTCSRASDAKPGQAGVCLPLAHKGEKCGGGTRFAPVCEEGTTCEVNHAKPGKMGTCRSVYGGDYGKSDYDTPTSDYDNSSDYKPTSDYDNSSAYKPKSDYPAPPPPKSDYPAPPKSDYGYKPATKHYEHHVTHHYYHTAPKPAPEYKSNDYDDDNGSDYEGGDENYVEETGEPAAPAEGWYDNNYYGGNGGWNNGDWNNGWNNGGWNNGGWNNGINNGGWNNGGWNNGGGWNNNGGWNNGGWNNGGSWNNGGWNNGGSWNNGGWNTWEDGKAPVEGATAAAPVEAAAKPVDEKAASTSDAVTEGAEQPVSEGYYDGGYGGDYDVYQRYPQREIIVNNFGRNDYGYGYNNGYDYNNGYY